MPSTISLAEGQTASFEKTITEDDVRAFGNASGDMNPLHFDDAYARRTRFGKRIVHGMLTAGVISAALGTKLAPEGTLAVYLSQTLQFRRPVFIGETLRAECTVTTWDAEKSIATLSTTCANGAGEVVIRGEAQILIELLGD